jgi:hypothetical protein
MGKDELVYFFISLCFPDLVEFFKQHHSSQNLEASQAVYH